MIAPFLQFARLLTGLLLLTLAFSVVLAQTGSSDKPFDMEEMDPVAGAGSDKPQLQFRFDLIADVSLPGPLPRGGPYEVDDGIAIEVAGGFALVSWDGTLELLQPGDAESLEARNDSNFGLSADGRIRCSPMPEGWIKAEKHCESCRKTWRKKWKVRVPGSEFARPLVTDKRVYYGTTDNRVYSVKRRNGHRVWATDVGGRVIRPLALLRVPAPPDVRFVGPRGSRLMDLVLVVPGSGDSIIALEGRAGTRVARHELPENEAYVGSPVTRGAKVAVVRQRYDASDAALLLYELRPPMPAVAENADLASAGSDSGESESDPPEQSDPE